MKQLVPTIDALAGKPSDGGGNQGAPEQTSEPLTSSKKIKDLIKQHSLYLCLECGKCAASCPRVLSGKEYSPRLVAQKIVTRPDDQAFIESSVWDCLTCGLCEQRCPSGVEYSKLILEMRTILAQRKGLLGFRSHDGALHSWMRIMTSPELEQDRLGWLTPELKTTQSGPVAFFTGCAPYFDVFFSGLEVDTLSQAKNSIRLLNFLDIEPVVLPNERCCGHDLLWSGDRDNFEALAQLNYRQYKDAGVKEIITTCPECYQTWNAHMREAVPGFDLKVTHMVELLSREVAKGGLSFRPLETKVTFQDPCRLARGAGLVNEPRGLLSKIEGLKLLEMEAHGLGAICCGNSAFINCDAYTKRIQVERLKQAKATGAEMLVTACPKCMIHTTCAMRDPHQEGSLALPVKDLVSLLAEQIQWAQGEKPRSAGD